jgi:hypothetical protein
MKHSISAGLVLGLGLALALAAPALAQSQTPSTPASAPPAAAAPAASAMKAAPEDVSSLDGILKALYGVISGPAGQARNWDRFRSLFYDGARLIPANRPPDGGAPRARVLDVEGYVTRASNNMQQQGFYEQEIARRVDQFGTITHVFSTYASRHKADDPQPFARGINSIQLFYDGTRYWIITIFWDSERPDNPLPAKYLETVKTEAK